MALAYFNYVLPPTTKNVGVAEMFTLVSNLSLITGIVKWKTNVSVVILAGRRTEEENKRIKGFETKETHI